MLGLKRENSNRKGAESACEDRDLPLLQRVESGKPRRASIDGTTSRKMRVATSSDRGNWAFDWVERQGFESSRRNDQTVTFSFRSHCKSRELLSPEPFILGAFIWFKRVETSTPYHLASQVTVQASSPLFFPPRLPSKMPLSFTIPLRPSHHPTHLLHVASSPSR